MLRLWCALILLVGAGTLLACGNDAPATTPNTDTGTAADDDGPPLPPIPVHNYDGTIPVERLGADVQALATEYNTLVQEIGGIPFENDREGGTAVVMDGIDQYLAWREQLGALVDRAEGTELHPWIAEPVRVFGTARTRGTDRQEDDMVDAANELIAEGEWEAGIAKIGWDSIDRRLVEEREFDRWDSRFKRHRANLVPIVFDAAVKTPALAALEAGTLTPDADELTIPDVLAVLAAEAGDAGVAALEQAQESLKYTIRTTIGRKIIDDAFRDLEQDINYLEPDDATPERVTELRAALDEWKARAMAKIEGELAAWGDVVSAETVERKLTTLNEFIDSVVARRADSGDDDNAPAESDNSDG